MYKQNRLYVAGRSEMHGVWSDGMKYTGVPRDVHNSIFTNDIRPPLILLPNHLSCVFLLSISLIFILFIIIATHFTIIYF